MRAWMRAAELVEADGFADVELEEDEDGALQGGVGDGGGSGMVEPS